MKIYSTRGVRVEHVGINVGNYSSASGDLPKNIKHFQDWMDKIHPNWLNDGTNLNKNVSKGYGNGGSQTKKAYAKYGATYETALQSLMGSLGGMFSTGYSSSSNTNSTAPIESTAMPSTISATDPSGNKKPGMLWDKTKNTWVKGNDWIAAHPELSSTVKGMLGNLFNNVSTGKPVFGGKSGGGLKSKDKSSTADSSIPDEKKKMSKGMKIGLAVGGGVLLIVIGVIVFKSMKKKK